MGRNRPDFGFNEGKNNSMDKFFNMSNLQNQADQQQNQQSQGGGTGQGQIIPETQDRFDVENVIAIAQPIELDPDSNLYQIESIYKKFSRLSNTLNIYNIGPGILYIRISHDGISASKEFILYEGEVKTYDKIYEVRLRSPSANLRYRVTEYDISTISGQTFSGSRFKDRRDRSGVVVFQDDYESPTIKFTNKFFNGVLNQQSVPFGPAPVPAGSTILRSIDTSYANDFSIKTITGININDGAFITYDHSDFHVGKIAAQMHFASEEENAFVVGIVIDFFTGTQRFRGNINFVAGTTFGTIVLIDASGTGTPLFTGIPIFSSLIGNIGRRTWNVMKLSLDLGAQQYVDVVVNGIRFDLSNIPLQGPFPDATARHIEVELQNSSPPPAGGAKTVYFDNYIFTEDENLV